MSSWKEGMTAQKSQATEPVSIHGGCDTEMCSKGKKNHSDAFGHTIK